MKTKTEYVILNEERTSALELAVRSLIQKGWEPVGGVSCAESYSPGGSRYYSYAQAMIKNPATQHGDE